MAEAAGVKRAAGQHIYRTHPWSRSVPGQPPEGLFLPLFNSYGNQYRVRNWSKGFQRIVNPGSEPTSGSTPNKPPLGSLLSFCSQLVSFQRSVLLERSFASLESGNFLPLK